MTKYELLQKSEEKNMLWVLKRHNRLTKLKIAERTPSATVVEALFKTVHDSDFQDLDNRQLARSILAMWRFMDNSNNSKKRPVNDYDIGPLRG